jgi:hypothetical protein
MSRASMIAYRAQRAAEIDMLGTIRDIKEEYAQ